MLLLKKAPDELKQDFTELYDTNDSDELTTPSTNLGIDTYYVYKQMLIEQS